MKRSNEVGTREMGLDVLICIDVASSGHLPLVYFKELSGREKN